MGWWFGEVAVTASCGLAGGVLGGTGSAAAVGGLAAGWAAETAGGSDVGVAPEPVDGGDDEAGADRAGEALAAGKFASVTHWRWPSRSPVSGRWPLSVIVVVAADC